MELNESAMATFATSDSTAELDAALAKAQTEIHVAEKDKVNPAFRSKYADLTSVWEACRDALSKHGISVTQWPVHSDDNRLHIITRIACRGEWMRAHFSVPVAKQDAHGYGSATTYAKRYALAAAVGVVADEDDDGNAASARPRERGQRQEELITEKQRELIGNLLSSSALTDEERAKVQKRLAGGMTKQSASKCADWLLSTIESRKAAA